MHNYQKDMKNYTHKILEEVNCTPLRIIRTVTQRN